MKSSTMLYVFLSLQVEKSEIKGLHLKYKRIKKIHQKTNKKTCLKFGTIYINASNKNKMYFNNTVIGTTEMANGNNLMDSQ